jgi:hypothetical protein
VVVGVGNVVAGPVGVKVPSTATVSPAALVVVYVYGVGPPGVRFVVGAGCPTGPCCLVVEVVDRVWSIVFEVVDVVAAVVVGRTGPVIVCL